MKEGEVAWAQLDLRATSERNMDCCSKRWKVFGLSEDLGGPKR
tara:strand:- start:488 stop:616 length:129 start_codon:yes stop_codon:yes gene_type:complete